MHAQTHAGSLAPDPYHRDQSTPTTPTPTSAVHVLAVSPTPGTPWPALANACSGHPRSTSTTPAANLPRPSTTVPAQRDPGPGKLDLPFGTAQDLRVRWVVKGVAVGDQGMAAARLASVDSMKQLDHVTARDRLIGRLHLSRCPVESRPPARHRWLWSAPTCYCGCSHVQLFRRRGCCEPGSQYRADDQQHDGCWPKRAAHTERLGPIGT